MSNNTFDIMIIGGGMVGASLACALGNQAVKVAVIEAFPFRSDDQPSYDSRSIALAYGSRRIFESMGIWPRLRDSVTPITNIHISDKGHFGTARLNASAERVPALGYVVENRVLGNALGQALNSFDNIKMFCPASLIDFTVTDEHVSATVEQDGTHVEIRAKLLVAADGGKSSVREKLNIGVQQWEYGQSAVISNVTTSLPHNNIAYERFTDTGPIALLPLSDNRCSLVYTINTNETNKITALSDDAFLQLLQQRFGHRLGKFLQVGKRVTYPLTLLRSRENIRERIALIGNASHTLHPVAGQGFNLGIRDVAALAEVIINASRCNADPGALETLQRYDQWRKQDYLKVIALTDGLARVFSSPLPLIAHARSASLALLDLTPGAKHLLSRQTMGLAGNLPRLARGLAL